MPMPAAIRFVRNELGNEGSLMPVTGFRSRKGARAANSGRGRSSSSWKPMQSQWCDRLADFLFQYSRNVTAMVHNREIVFDYYFLASINY